jgi:hypothetical protein
MKYFKATLIRPLLSALRLLAVLALLLAFTAAASGEETAEGYSKIVELEWEPIPGAESYELKLTLLPTEKSEQRDRYFTLKTNRWEERLKAGRYELRVRGADRRGVAGEWSDPQSFEVALPQVKVTRPAPEAVFASQHDSEELEFSWEPISGVTSYTVEIMGSKETMGTTATVKGTAFKTALAAPGAYRMRVWAQGDDGYEAEAKPPFINFSLAGRKLESPKLVSMSEMQIVWSRPEKATEFHIELTRLKSEKSAEKLLLSKKNYQELSLSRDKLNKYVSYRLSVVALAAGYQASDPAVIEIPGKIRPPKKIKKVDPPKPATVAAKPPESAKKPLPEPKPAAAKAPKKPTLLKPLYEARYLLSPSLHNYESDDGLTRHRLQVIYFNQHTAEGRARFFRSPRRELAALARISVARRVMYDYYASPEQAAWAQSTDGVNAALELASAESGLSYRLLMPGGAQLEFYGGLKRGNFNTFHGKWGVEAAVPASVWISEIMTGIGLGMMLTPTVAAVGSVQLGILTNRTQLTFTKGAHARLAMDVEQKLGFPRLRAIYRLSLDQTAYTIAPSGSFETETNAQDKAWSAGCGISYQL